MPEAGTTFATVGVASAQILAANPRRGLLVLTNDSDTAIYLSFGGPAAVVGSGVRLNAGGGSIILDRERRHRAGLTAAVFAISTGAAKNLAIEERDLQ